MRCSLNIIIPFVHLLQKTNDTFLPIICDDSEDDSEDANVDLASDNASCESQDLSHYCDTGDDSEFDDAAHSKKKLKTKMKGNPKVGSTPSVLLCVFLIYYSM